MTPQPNNSPQQTPAAQQLGRRSRRLLLVVCAVLLFGAFAYHKWGRCYYVAHRLTQLLDSVQISKAELLARSSEADVQCSRTRLLIIRTYRFAGDVPSAEKLLSVHEQLAGSSVRIARERTLNRARQGQLDGADNQLAALLRDPEMDGRDVCESFAVGFRLNRRFDEAAMLLAAWQRDWPKDYRPHYHEGLMRQTLTNWELAIASYQTALEFSPSSDECRTRLGECLNQLQRSEEAVEQFQIVVQHDPENQSALLGLANALKKSGRFAASRECSLKLLKLSPDSFAARLAVAEIDFATNDIDTALEAATSLSEVWPDDVATLYLLSQIQAAQGQSDKSKSTLERWTAADEVVQQVENDIQVLAENAGDIDLQVSVGARMLRHYSREMGHQFIVAALQIRPGHATAAAVLDDYSRRQKRIAALPVPPSKGRP